MNRLIEIRTGSDSDIPKIRKAYEFLDAIKVDYSPRILSAHRTPEIMARQARNLSKDGFRVSIAAAGGSAHLPGMTASETIIPVVGLPVMTSALNGVDSLYSIVQMPDGIPVGCVGISDAKSAAILAAQIAYLDNIDVRNRIRKQRGLKTLQSFKLKPLVCVPTGKLEKKLSLLKEFGLDISEQISDDVVAIISSDMNVAKKTDVPVIIVPDKIKIHQAPVAVMGINKYENAALYAVQIASLYFPSVRKKMLEYRKKLSELVKEKDVNLQKYGISGFL